MMITLISHIRVRDGRKIHALIFMLQFTTRLGFERLSRLVKSSPLNGFHALLQGQQLCNLLVHGVALPVENARYYRINSKPKIELKFYL